MDVEFERATLVAWAMELVAFANGEPAPFNRHGAHNPLPLEDRTAEQLAALRETARRRLAQLAEPKSDWQPGKQERAPDRLLRAASRWLNDPSVTTTRAPFPFVPMDVLPLMIDNTLEVRPSFRSLDAQFAFTFSALILPNRPALIGRCSFKATKSSEPCGKFFTHLLGAGHAGRPPRNCEPHRSDGSANSKVRKAKHRGIWK